MDTFLFKAKKVILYGAGSVAKAIAEVFDREGIAIAAYVDRRSDVIKTHEGIPVMSMEQVSDCITEKDNYVIVITIRNVFEHSKLAKQFYEIGYRNIIYKPQSVLQGISDETFDSINESYEILTAESSIPLKVIMCYKKEMQIISDEALQSNCGEYSFSNHIIANLPAELLFSNASDKNPVWSSQNFVANYIAVDLYKAFVDANIETFSSELSRYVDEFALPGAKTIGVNTEGNWRELLIDARLKVYNEMEYSLNMNPSFFSSNCTTVKYCEKHGFELIASGKNRVSFLIAKGYRYIPVKIEATDYTKYLNMPMVNRIYSYLDKDDKYDLFAPVPHPYFYRQQTAAPNYLFACIARIAKDISKDIYSELGQFKYPDYNLSVCINDEGCAGRYFKILGYQVERKIKQGQELCKLLDELFYFKAEDFSLSEDKYSFSIISTEFSLEEILLVIRNTLRTCFLIAKKSDKCIEIKREFAMHGFVCEKRFMETMWSGQYVEGWKYIKRKEE